MILFNNKNRYKLLTAITLSSLLIGFTYFYYYNNIKHNRGQARKIKLQGLHELICKDAPYISGSIDQCGTRSIYKDSDWGVTAYYTIYGIATNEEAEKIAKWMLEKRKENNEENIPLRIEIYSISKSATLHQSKHQYKIYDKSF